MSDREQAADLGLNDELLIREWEVPWHAHCVPLIILILNVWIWISGLPSKDPQSWLLSWSNIGRGHLLPLGSYMFAHLSLFHLGLNGLALLVLSGPLVACFGNAPISWARFVYLYIGSGIAGGIAFVVANPDTTPVVGASGAIFGVLGALARVHPATGTVVPVGSRRTWLMTKFFFGNHAVLFAIAAAVAFVTGHAQSLAWEAHLGGLLFGFLAAPLFLDKAELPQPL